jgi:pimeloyl-ACP methyl ester carboxylesterase
MVPETRYAYSGDVSIAYQVLGEGPIDLLIVPGFISHLEQAWEDPSYARFTRNLASFSRLIQFDKRGTGLSDRLTAIPTLEERADDVRTVMDAAGSKRAALFGISEGGPMSIAFAATYPERVSELILYGSIAKGAWAPDYPWGTKLTPEAEDWLEGWRREWGGPYNINVWAPSAAHDPRFRQWWAKYLRLGASPSAVINLFKMNTQIDVRSILPAVRVPTLVLHRSGDRAVDVAEGRYLAEHIPGAKFIELSGEDHRSSIRSRSSSPARGERWTRTAPSSPCSSPTSSAQRSARRRWAMASGGTLCRATTPCSAGRSSGSGAGLSSRPATGFSRRLTGPAGR